MRLEEQLETEEGLGKLDREGGWPENGLNEEEGDKEECRDAIGDRLPLRKEEVDPDCCKCCGCCC